MVQERLFPKMDMFFKYEVKEGNSVYDSLKFTLLTVSRNKMLITYGCPLYRLMVELSATDKEFDALLSTKATQMKEGIRSLLQSGQASGEFTDSLDADTFAAYMLNATWGILSVSPSLSSSKQFLKQSNYILKELKTYTN